MKMFRLRGARAILPALIVAGLVAAGCGDSGDDAGSEPATKGADANKAPAIRFAFDDSGNSEKQAVASALKTLEEAFWNGDAKAACAAMTARAQKQFSQDSASCEVAVERTAQATLKSDIDQKPSTITAIDISGNRATVAMRDGRRAPVDVPLVKQDGRWKLSDLQIDYEARG
jgi:hypothetical protein